MMKNILSWLSRPKNLLKLFGLGLLTIIVFFTAVRLGIFGALPSFSDLENPDANLASEVYSADSVLIGKYYSSNRVNVSFNELSPWLEKALVATEDKRFYDHAGIDLLRTVKAVITLGANGGGSTITQQLAKNMFNDPAKNIVQRMIQKAKEYVIAPMLERRYTKQEIIAMYFNTVDFLNNADGIKSASRIYFNKLPKDLNLEESAMFVGMLQNPALYNPRRHEERTRTRRATVLSLMAEQGVITQAQFETAKDKPIKLNFHPESPSDGLAPYFRASVAEYLKKWCKENKKPDGTNWNIYTDGLKIYTTLDTRYQKYAEIAAINNVKRFGVGNYKTIWESERGKKTLLKAIKQTARYDILKDAGKSDKEIYDFFKTEKRKMTVFSYSRGKKDTLISLLDSIIYYKNHMQTAFMAIEPFTGYVKAWVGGTNFEFFKFDHCSPDVKRQVGSTFKPIQYALAVDNGWSPCMCVPCGPITITYHGTVWRPKGTPGGCGPMKYCLGKSINGAAAYMMKNFGPEALVDLAYKMGITTKLPVVPSICLGSADLSLYEMLAVYSTFPNAGISTKPQFLLRIEDKDGNVIQSFQTEMHEVFNDNTAYKMCQIMKGPVSAGGTAASLNGYGIGAKDMAGKTGTTNGNTDAWFIGYTPQLLAGVWVGYDDPMLKAGQGNRAAAPAWGKFMSLVYNDPKLGLDKNATFFTPSDASLVKNICSEGEEYLISDGAVGNFNDVDEIMDSEYTPR